MPNEDDKSASRKFNLGTLGDGDEDLAKAITAVDAAARKLLAGPLTEKAILVLIQHAIPGGAQKVSQTVIRDVLHAAAELKKRYVK